MIHMRLQQLGIKVELTLSGVGRMSVGLALVMGLRFELNGEEEISMLFFLRLLFAYLLASACLLGAGALLPKELERRFPLESIRVYEPHEQLEVTYEGWPLVKVFDALYGQAWRKSEVTWFECADGYRPTIDTEELKSGDAWLVIKKKGQKDFRLINKLHHGEVVELGPLYVVWDNLKNKKRRDLGASGWPYQVVKVEFTSFDKIFPKLAPPPKSSLQVQRGFAAFKNHCLACHKVNGEGGDKAPELNIPVNITEYIDSKWLKRWILDPASIRRGTLMPSFQSLTNADLMTEDVISYLKAMRSRKILE